MGDLHLNGVGTVHGARGGPLARGQQVHEGLVGVGLLVGGAHRLRGRPGRGLGAARGEDAAGHRGEGRGEGDGDPLPRDRAQVLDHLGGVPVAAAHAVRRHGAHDLAAQQVRLGRLARAGGAGGGDDHGLGLGEPRRVGGVEGEGRRGGVAAGYGDALGAGERGAGAGQLGEAVGPGAGVRGAVELLPVGRVPEPEVGAHVDHEHVRAELFGDGGGLPVRQREEHHVVPGERLGRGLLEHPVRQGPQVRLESAEPLPRVGVPGQRPDLDLGVREQQPQNLATRVPARPGNRRTYRHVRPPLDGMTIRSYARLCNGHAAGRRPGRRPGASSRPVSRRPFGPSRPAT
ncbi:hypothetical protein SGPA1_20260 [Streptomyces misionensis JCM 4497]